MATIPVIDLTSYYSGDPAARRELGRQLDIACRDTGFFTVSGHQVPPELVAGLLGVARDFFELTVEEKLRYRVPPDTQLRGYSPFQAHRLARSRGVETPPDLREVFSLGRPRLLPNHPVADPDALPFYRPCIWPERPAAFRAIYTRYYELLDMLARDLMRLFALGLGLEETYFDTRIDDNFAALNTFYYPAQSALPEAGQLRAGEHSDFGSLTILLQSPDAGGLEVMGLDGKWQYLPPQPGRLVINIGDLMAQWTNDRWRSTLHRVVNPPGEPVSRRSRISIGFFCHPNFETMIECLPSCRGADGTSRYEPVKAGTYMRRKILAVRMPPASVAA
jgi:isopenicillin N synthase-like dioxygenase